MEHRIIACEYGSLLANHTRTANTDVIQKAVDCMMTLDVALPTSIAAQLIERRVDEHMLSAAKDPRKLDVKYYISLIVVKPEFIQPEVDYHKLNYSTLVDVVNKKVLAQMQDAEAGEAAKIKEAADVEWQAGLFGVVVVGLVSRA